MNIPKRILPIIVVSQFFCTSLWFASNAVISDLILNFKLTNNTIGDLTSAVQFGFIIGTLLFAFLAIADRFSPSRVFFVSAILGAIFNLSLILESNTITTLLFFRFLTGFFLAGIYPVGMKIAADYYDKGLGKSLGFLVGALVLGTAFPHFLKEFTLDFSWQIVLISTSSLAVIGGLLLLFLVPNGPYRKQNQQLDLTQLFNVFKNKNFRGAAVGYFGHMWELYAFWTFVPIMLMVYQKIHQNITFSVPLWSFIIIGLGALSCIAGGYISQSLGVKKTAMASLLLSGLCCFISPFIFHSNSSVLFIGFLIFWGLVVIADSPLFSTLVAKNAPAENRGTALTIVNCIGFAITIISIQLISILSDLLGSVYVYIFLVIGPVLGLVNLYSKKEY